MSSSGGTADPFLTHLVDVLNEHRPLVSIQRYEGPPDWQKDSILQSLHAILRRMHTAEETVKALKASEEWDKNNRGTKKRRSMDIDHGSPVGNGRVTSYTSNLTGGSSPSSHSRSRSHGSRNDSDSLDSSSMDFEMLDSDGSERGERPTSLSSNEAPVMLGASENVSSGLANTRASPSMNIDLNGLRPTVDAQKMFDRPYPLPQPSYPYSAPATTSLEHACCQACGRPYSDGGFPPLNNVGNPFGGTSDRDSPLVIPPGPLAAAAFESGMSAVEELRLLKTQVQDVSRVCQAVARGDLTQKITVPVQGVVMVQLKDVINTMVRPPILHTILVRPHI